MKHLARILMLMAICCHYAHADENGSYPTDTATPGLGLYDFVDIPDDPDEDVVTDAPAATECTDNCDGGDSELIALIEEPDYLLSWEELEEWYDKYLDELEENAKDMHDREQSAANKILTAAAIGVTGIGMMDMMSGMAEQAADEAAERDMKAYLATFACDYGAGRNITGGQTNIELPGGNALTTEITEYKALAADLKTRKEALGLQPGIEAELILDSADTGLYNNESVGRQSGAFASLSQALMDENSADAAAVAQQRADSAKQKQTGTTLTAIGVVGGTAGNLIINGNSTERSDQITQKYQEMLNKVGTKNE